MPDRRSSWRDTLLDVTTVAALVGTLGLAAAQGFQRLRSSADSTRPLTPPEWERAIAGGVSVGATEPSLTVVEFTDYECPACRKIQPRIDRLIRENPLQVRVVYRHWPLQQHRIARRAAALAVCAASVGKFEPVHALLMEDQHWMDEPSAGFQSILRQAGVTDDDEFRACLLSDSTENVIERDISEARGLGGLGTPTFVINSVLYQELPDSAELVRLLQRGRR